MKCNDITNAIKIIIQSHAFQFALSRALAYIPFKLISNSTIQERPNHANAHAFPSGHNKWAAYLAATALFLCQNIEPSTRKYLVGLGTVLVLSNMAGRPLARYHYPGDTVAGALLSLVGARLVQQLYGQDKSLNPANPQPPAAQGDTETADWVKMTSLMPDNHDGQPGENEANWPRPVRQQSCAETALTLLGLLTITVSNPVAGALTTFAVSTGLQIVGDLYNEFSWTRFKESITDKIPGVNNVKALYRHHQTHQHSDDHARLSKAQVALHVTSLAVLAGMAVVNAFELPFTMTHGWADEADRIVSWTSDSTASFFNTLTWVTACASVALGGITALAADYKDYQHYKALQRLKTQPTTAQVEVVVRPDNMHRGDDKQRGLLSAVHGPSGFGGSTVS